MTALLAYVAQTVRRGVAKLVKALDFDSSMRGFESFLPCQTYFADSPPLTAMCTSLVRK